jgi:hypothetical protein
MLSELEENEKVRQIEENMETMKRLFETITANLSRMREK